MALVQRAIKRDAYLIPDSLTHSGGVITAIFGSGIRTRTLPGLSANTLYFLYIEQSSGITVTDQIPSVRRAIVSQSILIGAMYSNGSGVFGSFVNIEGSPISDWTTLSGITLSNFGNATSNIQYRRVGDSIQSFGFITIGSTVPTGTLQVTYPFSWDATKTVDLPAAFCRAGQGSNIHIGKVEKASSTALNFYGDDGAGLWNATNPITFAAGNIISFDVNSPIIGWSSTPLKDL